MISITGFTKGYLMKTNWLNLPKISKITFKPCLKNQSVYDSVELVNQSDTPIYFKFAQDSNKVFKTFPRIGLI